MSFMDKMKDLVGIVDEYDEDYEISQDEIDEYKKELGAGPEAKPSAAPTDAPSRPRTFDASAVEPPQKFSSLTKDTMDRASRNDSAAFRMVVIEPKNIDECRKLIDNLKGNKPVIINLEKVETDLARKMFDFLSGATYALSGNIQKVNQNIYLFAPHNVNIKAMVDRVTEAGKPQSESPW